jgi:hypothetical protein
MKARHSHKCLSSKFILASFIEPRWVRFVKSYFFCRSRSHSCPQPPMPLFDPSVIILNRESRTSNLIDRSLMPQAYHHSPTPVCEVWKVWKVYPAFLSDRLPTTANSPPKCVLRGRPGASEHCPVVGCPQPIGSQPPQMRWPRKLSGLGTEHAIPCASISVAVLKLCAQTPKLPACILAKHGYTHPEERNFGHVC